MPRGAATAELCDLDYEQSDGDKLEWTDLVFREDGFELLFDPGQLSGIFLYLSPNRDDFPAFGGELTNCRVTSSFKHALSFSSIFWRLKVSSKAKKVIF